jgi:hypothetical protein
MLDFTPTASMVVRGRETGYGPVDWLVVVLWIEKGAIFLGAIALSNAVDDLTKGCHVLGLPLESVRVVYMD